MGFQLYDYQLESVERMLKDRHHCLFYKPGKGKTYVPLEVARRLGGDVLVLSTKGVIDNMWKADIDDIIEKFPELKGKIYCYNWEKLIKNDNYGKALLNHKFNVFICDEAHQLKSNTSKRSKLAKQLAKSIPNVYGLTGTPRCNSDIDIYAIFHNLQIAKEWNDISYWKFVDRYCIVDVGRGAYGTFKKPVGIQPSYKREFERILAEHADFADYEDNEMPELITKVTHIPCELSDEYKNAMKGIIDLGEDSTTMSKVVAINKAHQAINGYLYLGDNREVLKINGFKNDKLRITKDRISNASDFPTIIVYRFQEDLHELEKVIKGTTDFNSFKSGQSDILFLQAQQGVGFNLQRCKRIIFYSLDYSFVNYNQMIHRAWRKGQTDKVLVEILVYDKSIEDRIWYTVKNKSKFNDLFYSLLS